MGEPNLQTLFNGQWDGKHDHWCSFEGRCVCETDWFKRAISSARAELVRIHAKAALADEAREISRRVDQPFNQTTIDWIGRYDELEKR